jgi:hypothetical protein
VPAVGKRRGLLDLNQLRNKREAVLGGVEIRKHPLDRCADGDRLSNTLTHLRLTRTPMRLGVIMRVCLDELSRKDQ